jgi:hypothetical protein
VTERETKLTRTLLAKLRGKLPTVEELEKELRKD